MARTARASVGNVCYHVLNRGNSREDVFRKDADYAAFLKLLDEAGQRVPVRLLTYCLMPNHFHLVLWPREDGDLSRFMQWLLTSHVRRFHRHYGTCGHVWQGRFKAFPIQENEHLLVVWRYVERNPVRAGIVRKAQRWPWSSIGQPPTSVRRPPLHACPVPRGRGWLDWVNKPQTEAELTALRMCLTRGAPYGTERWQNRIAKRLGLESSLRPRGRPRKSAEK